MLDKHSGDEIDEYRKIKNKYKSLEMVLGVLFLFFAYLLEYFQ